MSSTSNFEINDSSASMPSSSSGLTDFLFSVSKRKRGEPVSNQ